MAITDYEIIKEIGRGGMGAVYLARDPRLDRLVAIKKIKVSSNVARDVHHEVVQRFYREARAIANLNHPNIVTVYELGEDSQTRECFMVMEYLKGKSLDGMLEEEKFLPVNLVLKIGIQLCDALNYMHQRTVIHRDIKPGNLIYCDDGMLKLTDFGLVKSSDDNMELTRAGTLLGSVLYMAPEQIENPKNVDVKVDMYAFGVTMFQILCGEFPYNGDNVWEVISKITTGEPASLTQLNPRVPREIEKIIMKTLARKKENRYASMAEVQEELVQYNMLKVQTIISPLGYARGGTGSLQLPETAETSVPPEEIFTSAVTAAFPVNEEYIKTTITRTNGEPDFLDTAEPNLMNTSLLNIEETVLDDDSFQEVSEIDLHLKELLELELLSSVPAGTDRLEKLRILEESNLKQQGNLEQTLKYLNTVFQEMQQENKNLSLELKELTLEYNSNINSRGNMTENMYQSFMKDLKKKIELKKQQREGKSRELEFITKKFEIYKALFDSRSLRKKVNALMIETAFFLEAESFYGKNKTVFQVSEKEADETKNIIFNRIRSLQEVHSLSSDTESMLAKLEEIEINYSNNSGSQPSAVVIRLIPKTQTVEAKLLEDVESNSLMEIDLDNSQVFLVNCGVIHNNRPVLKAAQGSIVLLKSDNFVDELKPKFKTNIQIFKAKNRLYRKDLMEREIKAYRSISSLLQCYRELLSENVYTGFDSLSQMFTGLDSTELNMSPESKQLAIAKTNKIRKGLFDLKKELETLNEPFNMDYTAQINSTVQATAKFPLILKNYEREAKNRQELRKKNIQSVLIQISKSDTSFLQDQIDQLMSRIEALKEFEIPDSMASLLKFYLLSKAHLPTEISKNQLIDNLNKERERFNAQETDWVCRLLNLRYTRDRGFLIKVGL